MLGNLMSLKTKLITMYSIFAMIIICGCGSPNNSPTHANNTNIAKLLQIDSDWKKIQKQTLDDISKSQKMNLFGKCFYYEQIEICQKILTAFQTECDNGIGLSCGLLSTAYMYGRGVEQNKTQALTYIKKGCYYDDSLSCMYLRKYLLQYNETKRSSEILHTTQIQCNNNGALECFLLSLLYENDPAFSSYRKNIIEYRKKACDKKFALACGYIDDKDLPKATYELYQQRACDLGMMSACDAFRGSTEINLKTKHARLYRIW